MLSKFVNFTVFIDKKSYEFEIITYQTIPKPTKIEPKTAQPKKNKDASILPRELEDKFKIL